MFGHWAILKRDEDRDDSHGPRLVSILYFGGEMSAIYQGLYCRLKVAPKVLAIIQPGAIGGEWECVTRSDSFFHKVVASNPAGMPAYLLYGGMRGCDADPYSAPCWNEYAEPRLVQLPERYASLFTRKP